MGSLTYRRLIGDRSSAHSGDGWLDDKPFRTLGRRPRQIPNLPVGVVNFLSLWPRLCPVETANGRATGLLINLDTRTRACKLGEETEQGYSSLVFGANAGQI